MYDYSSFSDRSFSDSEVFRMTGTLPESRIEKLLEKTANIRDLSDEARAIDDIKAGLPSEDFLFHVKERLNRLAKNLRGNNREELAGIIEVLDEIELTQSYANEFAIESLNSLEKVLTQGS